MARRLAAAGAGQSLLVRDASRVPQLPGVEVADVEFGRRCSGRCEESRT
ncbi:hypothetical protein AB0J42_07905 [Nonomuraea sp. NPDC049649]